MGVLRREIWEVEQICSRKCRFKKRRIAQITLCLGCVGFLFSYKSYPLLFLKPTVGDFTALVFCESSKRASLGWQYREKQAPYVTGNFLLFVRSESDEEQRCELIRKVRRRALSSAALFPI